MKNAKYGLSVKTPNEAVFASGRYSCIEYCKPILDTPEAFEIIEKESKILLELKKKYNVDIRSFHLPFGTSEYFAFQPSSLDSKMRASTLELTKRLIELVAPTGIEIVVIHGSLRVLPEDRQKRLDVFVDYIKKLCDFCNDLGIKVAVETLKPRCIGNGLKEHIYIQQKANRKNLGICFDSNHLLDEDNLHFLNGAGEYVITTHLSDYDGVDEKHWYPGRGINDWQSIVRILNEKGYSGPYVFEVDFAGTPGAEEINSLLDEWEAIFK